MPASKPSGYLVQDGCHCCRHCVVSHFIDFPVMHYCNLDGSKPKVHNDDYLVFENWGDTHNVDPAGICDEFTLECSACHRQTKRNPDIGDCKPENVVFFYHRDSHYEKYFKTGEHVLCQVCLTERVGSQGDQACQ